MATLATLTTDTTNLLYGLDLVSRPQEDTIGAALTSSGTSVTVDTDTIWKRNDLMEFQPDGELAICAADASSGTVTVRRAQRGTTAAAQDNGDVILKNPPYPISQVQTVINQVIRSDLWPHVWTWEQNSFSFVSGDHMYDLGLNIVEVVMVYQFNLNSDNRLHPLPNTLWDVERQINTAAATNSNLLRVVRVHDEDETVYYTAKRRPDESDIANFSDELADIIPWAAAAKLLASRSPQVSLDAARSRHDDDKSELRDYRGLMAEFLRMRDALNLQLRDEVFTEPRFRPRFRRRF